eukprot:233104-Amphidinium_carterae.1
MDLQDHGYPQSDITAVAWESSSSEVWLQRVILHQHCLRSRSVVEIGLWYMSVFFSRCAQGCEILKDLALSGFTDIHVIDMDTIDVTNLNRQFLFRQNDVGKAKAEVAASFINKRCGHMGVKVTPYCCKIQEKDESFYRQFNIIVAGLDNIGARRWMNATLHSMVDRSSGAPD